MPATTTKATPPSRQTNSSGMNTNRHTLNFLEKLLDGAEVEWVALGEVAAYSKSQIGFKELDPASYVGVDNLLPEKAGKTNSSYVPTQGNLTKYYANDILIGNIRLRFQIVSE